MDSIVETIKNLKDAATRTLDKQAFDILTLGQSCVQGKYMYLDRARYKGRGRPRIADYVNAQPLFINE